MSILKSNDVDEAWRILGEQSEFMIDLMTIHKEEDYVHPRQITQFMHYFMNMLGLHMKSIFFFPKIPEKIECSPKPDEVIVF